MSCETVFKCLVLLACAIVPDAWAAGAPEQRAFGPIQPRLSPDGQQVAFSWQGAICRMQVPGGALTVLTRGEGFDIEPAWSPEGNTIAFINTANFSAGQLQWINAEDGSTRKLEVKAGDKVLIGKYSGSDVKLNGDEHIILREDDVLAVLEK